MRVGLYAPYDFGETTHLACSIGDLARALGMSVTYLAYQRREQRVRDYWDAHVLSERRTKFDEWIKDLDMLVWFDLHRKKLQIAQASSCLHTLVPLWHRLQPVDSDLLREFNYIAAPCSGLSGALVMAGLSNVITAPWYAGPRPYTPNPEPVEDGKLKLYVNMDGQTSQRVGADMLSALHVLLSRRPSLEVTLALAKQWTKGAAQRLHSLAKQTGRLRVCRHQTHTERLAQYTAHDWVICPSLAANTGYDAVEALVYGCPVVAFDIPPYNEFIQASHNGALLVCDPQSAWLDAPQMTTSAHQLLTMLDGIASNPDLLERLKRRDWTELETRSRAFMLAWRQIWDC